jgi:two-component system cell cycle response regulator
MPARILIIEDNLANLDLMVYLLRAFGYTPLTAEDGQSGLDLALEEAERGIDLLICDVQLPRLEGHRVVARLRAHPAFQGTPMLAVTALAMVGDRERIIEAGFTDHLSKPIEPETFVDRVESFLPPELKAPRVMYPANDGPPDPGWEAPPLPRALTENSPLILMVDDVPHNIDFVRATLEPFGYRLIATGSVREGLDYVRQGGQSVDMVLCDLHMDPDDGRNFLDQAPHVPELAGVPVIIISSTFTTEDECLECLERGARLFIRRPIEPEALLAEVQRILPAIASD